MCTVRADVFLFVLIRADVAPWGCIVELCGWPLGLSTASGAWFVDLLIYRFYVFTASLDFVNFQRISNVQRNPPPSESAIVRDKKYGPPAPMKQTFAGQRLHPYDLLALAMFAYFARLCDGGNE